MYYLDNSEVDPAKLFQGDIFEPIPCSYMQQTNPIVFRENGQGLVPSSEDELSDAWQREELILVKAIKRKIILLSQTCDIHEEKYRNLQLDPQQKYDYQFILYAPVIPITQLDEYPRLRRNIDNLRKQNAQGAFWLPEDTEKGIEESVVYLPLICSMLKRRDNRFLTFHPRRRLASLKSPYREALGHKLGDMISRVALPSDFIFNTANAVPNTA